MASARSRTASALSSKLQQGYKLLSRHCPECTTPLLKKGEDVYCCGCDQFALTEAQAATMAAASPASLLASSQSGTTAAFRRYEDEGAGEGEDEDFDEYDDGWKPPTKEEQAIIDARMRRSDEISSEMGKLMLQRWTMLSDSCTDCATPLMRSPKMEHYCVGCQKNTPSPEESRRLAELEHDKKSAQPAVGAATTAASASATQQSASTRAASSSAAPQTAAIAGPAGMLRLAPVAVIAATVATVAAPAVVAASNSAGGLLATTTAQSEATGDSTAFVLEQSMLSMWNKMELQSCRLEMNSTSDLARCTQLAQLIGALASSIQACRSIRP